MYISSSIFLNGLWWHALIKWLRLKMEPWWVNTVMYNGGNNSLISSYQSLVNIPVIPFNVIAYSLGMFGPGLFILQSLNLNAQLIPHYSSHRSCFIFFLNSLLYHYSYSYPPIYPSIHPSIHPSTNSSIHPVACFE